jgi:hypothetical protein
VILPCGHTKKDVHCYETLAEISCREKVERVLAGCNHKVTVTCGTNVDNFKCLKKCGADRPCGHTCDSACGDCLRSSSGHVPCNAVYGRTLSCSSHNCRAVCHSESNEPCPPCKGTCDLSGTSALLILKLVYTLTAQSYVLNLAIHVSKTTARTSANMVLVLFHAVLHVTSCLALYDVQNYSIAVIDVQVVVEKRAQTPASVNHARRRILRIAWSIMYCLPNMRTTIAIRIQSCSLLVVISLHPQTSTAKSAWRSSTP